MVPRMCPPLFHPRLMWMSHEAARCFSVGPKIIPAEASLVRWTWHCHPCCLCWIRSLEGGNNKSLASPKLFEGDIGEFMKQCLRHSQRLAHGSWSHLSKCLFQSALTHSPLAATSNPAPSPFLCSFLLQTLQRCCLDLCWPTLQPLHKSEMMYSKCKIHTRFQSLSIKVKISRFF